MDQPAAVTISHRPMATIVPPPPPRAERFTCDICGEPIEGEPAGHAVLVWTRGDERREERDPICPACAAALGLSVQRRLEEEDDGG